MNGNTTEQKDHIEQTVLDKIRTGKVSMRPRVYFMSKIALVALVLFLLVFATAFLVSYILFDIKASGQVFLLGFGGQGLLIFFLLFPWKILFAEILLLVVLERLLQRFQFGYRNPFLYVLAALVFAVTVVTSLINLTPLHSGLMHRAKETHMPIFGEYYENIQRVPPGHGVFRGNIIRITDDSIILHNDDYDKDSDDGVRTIFVTPELRAGIVLQEGDRIYAAGQIINGDIHAYGIRKIFVGDEMK
jgi:hypothetical protein